MVTTGTSGDFFRVLISSSMKPGAGANNPGRVDLPVEASVFPHDLPAARSWVQQLYPKLFHWNECDHGGHFTSLEVLLADDFDFTSPIDTVGRSWIG